MSEEVFVKINQSVDNLNVGETGRFTRKQANNLVERGLGVITGHTVIQEDGKRGIVMVEHPEGAGDEASADPDLDDQQRITASLAEKDLQTARGMYDMLRTKLPDIKEPDFKKWANEVRLLREQKNVTIGLIREVFAWAREDETWQKKIKTAMGFRKNFDEIVVARKVADAAAAAAEAENL